MENSDNDNFFIQFDFEKAFDSIDQNFLFKCLEKMNFPKSFIKFLKKLYNSSVSKVMVHGFLSKAFKLSRGSRQGDPLSLYIFVIVLNALIIYLNENDQLLPFISKSNKKFLTQGYADDLNLTTRSTETILKIFNILEEFRKVSGLKVNYDKTKGLIFNKSGNVNTDILPLPSSNWNCNLKILGIPYGSESFVANFWQNILQMVKTDLKQYQPVYSTFDAKSIITKSLILPKVSYAASVINIPSNVKKNIDASVFRYVLPKGKFDTNLTMLAQNDVLVDIILTM